MYKDLKGLKFPDNAVIKFFFKEHLHEKCGKVLEYACSNGNNLSLFASYGWECLGVDLNELNIQNAEFNFKEILKAQKFSFFEENILDFAKAHKGVQADVFLVPNVVNYLRREDFLALLKSAKEFKAYKENALFFLRTRGVRDYRYGLGKKIAHNSFLLDCDESTGELNCINTLYQEYELVGYLQEFLGLYDFKVLSYESTNVMGADERLVNDADIVIYGRIR